MNRVTEEKIRLIVWAFIALVLGVGVPALGAHLAVLASEKVFVAETLVMVVSEDIAQGENEKSILTTPTPSPDPIRVNSVMAAVSTEWTSAESVLQKIEESLPKKTALHVNSQSFLVADFETGESVLEKNPDKVFPVASLTKLTTALVALDIYKPDKVLTVPESATLVGGTTGQLRVGEKITVSDLLHALLMQSANDAAETLAVSYGRDDFVTRMKQKAKSLGARSTRFADPTGLSNKNVSTASDLLKISQYIFNNKTLIADITHLKTYKGKNHTWTNATKFLALPEYVGGKTGYTNEAGRTAVSIFDLEPVPFEKRKVVVVILKSEARDQDILTILEHIHKSPFLLSSNY